MISDKAKEVSALIWQKEDRGEWGDGEYVALCQQLRSELTRVQLECLGQLVNFGPVWDGDICSKQARGELFDLRLASRAMVRGKEGFSVATYHGARVLSGDRFRADKAKEHRLLSLPLGDLTAAQLQERFEIEEDHAVSAMKRAEETRARMRGDS